MRDAIEHAQFRDAIQSAGPIPPDVIVADDEKHRFASNGKRGDDAGEYRLYADDIPAGYFKDYRTDLYQTWQADVGRILTPAEEATHKAREEAMRRLRMTLMWLLERLRAETPHTVLELNSKQGHMSPTARLDIAVLEPLALTQGL